MPGKQTRLIRFNAPAVTPRPDRQGLSIARWDGRGALKVVTNNLLPGYLQSNGAPYSAKTTMTEYFDVLKEANGDAVAAHRCDRRGSAVPDPVVHQEHALQEASRRDRMGSVALYRQMNVRQMNRHPVIDRDNHDRNQMTR